MQSIDLGSCTFTAAHLRRTGGQLAYNDELIPPGAEVQLVHAQDGAASVVIDGNRLAAICAKDIHEYIFDFIDEIPDQEAKRMFVNLIQSSSEVIPGDKLALKRGTVLLRTGRPMISVQEGIVPYQIITVARVDPAHIAFETIDFQYKVMSSRYATNAYFEIVR